jgi:CelD/BcsL family acetyltransferase involved in cellulose biosynthesis
MSRASTILSDPLQVVLLEAAGQFRVYKDAWQGLERVTPNACFFESYSWCGHVAETLSLTFLNRYAPLVAIGTRQGVVVALWPLSRQKRSGIWQLRPLDHPFGQFAGILYSDEAAAEELVKATLALVRAKHLADVLRIDRVLDGSPLHVALTKFGASTRGQVGAPVIDTRPWPSFEALKSSRNKKTMKNLRNSMNRLSKAGKHEHHVATGDQKTIAIIKETFRLRSEWLDDKGLTAPQFRSAAHEDILLGGEAWQLDSMRTGFELVCDGKPIAYQWGFLHLNRYYAYMSATNPEAILLSPGRLHLAFVVSESICRGVDGMELLTPASSYKLVWTDTVRRLVDMAMPLSARGRIHDLLWERSLRPMLKASFYAMPAFIRRRAVLTDAAASADHD